MAALIHVERAWGPLAILATRIAIALRSFTQRGRTSVREGYAEALSSMMATNHQSVVVGWPRCATSVVGLIATAARNLGGPKRWSHAMSAAVIHIAGSPSAAGIPAAAPAVRTDPCRPGRGALTRECRGHGFTLLEVMIVVAIVAILAAIALPSYRNQVIKANRSAAQQFMSDVSNREEQYLLDQRSYTNTIGAGGLNTTPTSDVAANYTFAAATTGNDCLGTALIAPAYVITATAIGSQLSDGNLCLDNRGNKTPAAKWAP